MIELFIMLGALYAGYRMLRRGGERFFYDN